MNKLNYILIAIIAILCVALVMVYKPNTTYTEKQDMTSDQVIEYISHRDVVEYALSECNLTTAVLEKDKLTYIPEKDYWFFSTNGGEPTSLGYYSHELSIAIDDNSKIIEAKCYMVK